MKEPKIISRMEAKVCSKCSILKPMSDFYKDRRYKDGHVGVCKLCKQTAAKICRDRNATQYKLTRAKRDAKNRDKLNAYARQYRQLPKQKEYMKSYNKQYAQKDCSVDFTSKLPDEDKAQYSDDILSVLCYHCRGRFTPTNSAVQDRYKSFRGTHDGVNNFYCSDKCKQECVVYKHRPQWTDTRSSQYVPKTEQEEARNCQTDHLKQLQCDEFNHNYCEKCQDIIDVELHHTWLISTYGKEAINSAGHMLLCAGCHTELHGAC